VLLHSERCMTVEGTPALGAVLVAIRHTLRELLDVPGTVYACAADPAGPVVADAGSPDPKGEAEAVLQSLAPVVLATGIDDILVTSAVHHHVIRRFPVGSRTLVVHMVLDRSRGNLALARHTLASADFRSRLEAAGCGRAAAARPRTVWVGGTRPVPPRVTAVPPRSPVRDCGRDDAASWLLLASLLADESAGVPAALHASVA
jgi:hypothetical protein